MRDATIPEFHVGTSGFHYAHWKNRFYPPEVRVADRLSYYAKHFDFVELNNTFYRLPPETAVLNWKQIAPAHFRFAVKGSRFLTHMKELREPETALERFFSRVDLLRPKLGPILSQLPPRWEADPERLRLFLEALPPRKRYAFEFRDRSWNNSTIYGLLTQFKAAYCIFDLAGFQSPMELTANFTYVRLHGPGGRYQGRYCEYQLNRWACRLLEWNLKDAYVFFDNDQNAYAVENAKHLRSLLGLDSVTL